MILPLLLRSVATSPAIYRGCNFPIIVNLACSVRHYLVSWAGQGFPVRRGAPRVGQLGHVCSLHQSRLHATSHPIPPGAHASNSRYGGPTLHLPRNVCAEKHRNRCSRWNLDLACAKPRPPNPKHRFIATVDPPICQNEMQVVGQDRTCRTLSPRVDGPLKPDSPSITQALKPCRQRCRW